jgi:Recombination endonuclease VII
MSDTTMTPKTYNSDNPCPKCGSHEKYLSNNRCFPCRVAYYKIRAQSAAGKAASKKYWQSPKGKAKRKEHEQSTATQIYRKKWNASEHGKKLRRYEHVRRTYGLTPEQYETMIKKQNEKCAICSIKLERPYVDHDHNCCAEEKSCGKCVRGLICFKCNRLLGDCQDSIKILQSAVTYLNHHQLRGIM